MACLVLKKEADYLVHDAFTVETEDHEDHTFNGMMFNINVKQTRPVQSIVVDALHVRGGLGKMSVWWTEGGYERKQERESEWRCCFKAKVAASWREFTKLTLSTPMVLKPGECYGIYVHSAEEGDAGVVYDNQRESNRATHDDDFISVLPGMAHLSPVPFSEEGPWWGSPWRRPREFVGKLSYGARYVLWDPRSHAVFSSSFRSGASTFFASLAIGWYGLPSDVVLFILNMARYDWFDNADTIEPPTPEATHTPNVLTLERQRLRYLNDYSRFDQIDSDDEDSDEDYTSSRVVASNNNNNVQIEVDSSDEEDDEEQDDDSDDDDDDEGGCQVTSYEVDEVANLSDEDVEEDAC